MTTADRLRKELEQRKITNTEIGQRCRPPVTPTSVGRWLKLFDTLSDERWARFATGLKAVGLRPEDYREIVYTTGGTVRPDLIPLIDRFTKREQLEALQELIIDDDGHSFVLSIIADRIKRV